MALTISRIKKNEFTYIPVEERENKNPVKVKIKLLPKVVRVRIEDGLLKINQDGSFGFANASYILEMFKKGVKDIEGLVDEEGKPIEVEKDAEGNITDDFLEILPDDFIQEVGNVIISISKDPKNAKFYLGEVNDK